MVYTCNIPNVDLQRNLLVGVIVCLSVSSLCYQLYTFIDKKDMSNVPFIGIFGMILIQCMNIYYQYLNKQCVNSALFTIPFYTSFISLAVGFLFLLAKLYIEYYI